MPRTYPVEAVGTSRPDFPIKILISASDFAFGPTATLLSLLPKLKALGSEVTFVGRGSAYELVSREGGLRAIELPASSSESRALISELCANNDAAVSAMSADFLEVAAAAGLPTVWLDILSWWGDLEISPASLKADLFISQRSLPDGQRIAKLHSILGARLLSVGPIVDVLEYDTAISPEHSTDFALVNLGGFRLPVEYSKTTYTAFYRGFADFLDLLRSACQLDLVIVSGQEGARVASSGLERKFERQCVSHSEFTHMVARAKALITPPGLIAPLEAWCSGTPVLFLPPSNQAQVAALAEYRRVGLASRSAENGFPLPSWYDATLIEVLRAFMMHDHARSLAAIFSEILGSEMQLERLRHAGAAFIGSLGGTGTSQAAEGILRIARNGKPQVLPSKWRTSENTTAGNITQSAA